MRKSLIGYGLLSLMFVLIGPVHAQQLDTPQQISPADGETIYGVFGEIQEVTLLWHSVADATGYCVLAGTVIGSISDTIDVTTTNYVNRRQSPGQWQWQVKALGVDGAESAWSPIWLYTYSTQQPTPTPEGYPKVDVWEDENFDYRDIFAFQQAWGAVVDDPEYNYFTDLVTDGKIDEKDLLLMAKAWKYRGSVKLVAPELLTPATGTTITFIQAQNFGLKWIGLPGDDPTIRYNIRIEHQQGLGPTVDELIDGTDYSFKSTITGFYDWKVRARDPKTLLFGPWSEERDFNLQGQPTPTP